MSATIKACQIKCDTGGRREKYSNHPSNLFFQSRLAENAGSCRWQLWQLIYVLQIISQPSADLPVHEHTNTGGKQISASTSQRGQSSSPLPVCQSACHQFNQTKPSCFWIWWTSSCHIIILHHNHWTLSKELGETGSDWMLNVFPGRPADLLFLEAETGCLRLDWFKVDWTQPETRRDQNFQGQKICIIAQHKWF